MTLGLAGCEANYPVAASSPNRVDTLTMMVRHITIDAGVVLADRDGYLCISLNQIGLPPETRIS
ncbi:MAG: hypothetical protein KDB03_17355 [Planctomycetales bacterium]|nr:hypothetical protein [Planctomycetales bacterium]